MAVSQAALREAALLFGFPHVIRGPASPCGTDVFDPVEGGGRVCLEAVPAFEWMLRDHAGDAVLDGLPHTAPVVRVAFARARGVPESGLDFPGRFLEVGKEKRMRCHQFLQGFLGVVLPAGRVDVKSHGDVVGPLEPDGPEDVFAVWHFCFSASVVGGRLSPKAGSRRGTEEHGGPRNRSRPTPESQGGSQRMPSSSTSKISVAFEGMAPPPAPCSP